MNIKRRVPLFTALLLGFLLGKVCGSSPKVFIPGEQPYGLDSHGPAKSFDEIAHALEGDIIKTSTPRILRKDAGRSDSEIFNTRRFRFSQDFFCPRSQSSINPCGQLSSEESIGAPWAVHGHLIRVADATSVQINPPKNPEGCGFGDHRATVRIIMSYNKFEIAHRYKKLQKPTIVTSLSMQDFLTLAMENALEISLAMETS
eukprot:m.221584 g.221584  ORF g.221584 m.221584 type:complete len:202 (-) comp15928_c0_seq20:1503-2108(-)